MNDARERLERDLERPGGLGPQIVSSSEAIVEKADLRTVLDALSEMRELVGEFARQKLTREMDQQGRAVGDFEGAYDEFILKSRALLERGRK